MASKRTIITITHPLEAYQTILDRLLRPSSHPRAQFLAIRNFFHAVAGGDRRATVVTQVDTGEAVAASGTLTLASIVQNDTLAVGTVTFTAKTSPTLSTEWAVGASDTACAAALAAKINAHPSLTNWVTATSALGVVTITSKVKGLIGNYITLTAGTHSTRSAANLASGADSTTYSTSTTYTAA